MPLPPPPASEARHPPRIDAVTIGRNEGARLEACLRSLRGQVRRIVYVDSGSNDGSPSLAASFGAEVVALDMAHPFTAARARNAGLAALRQADTAPYIQLIDGDCTLREPWLAAAAAFLDAHPQAALVFGRRRERFPAASVYNQLCDHEWNTPPGPARACGGDILIRAAAFAAVGGYREDVIAAEDDEICQRLLAGGWTLWRIEAEMSWHDAAITRFGQWWRRAVRAGHGFAQVGALHPAHFRAARRRVWLWGAVLPGVALAAWGAAPAASVAVAGLYALSGARSAWRFWREGTGWRAALGCGALIMLSKFPNLQGILLYHWRARRGAEARIIEYK